MHSHACQKPLPVHGAGSSTTRKRFMRVQHQACRQTVWPHASSAHACPRPSPSCRTHLVGGAALVRAKHDSVGGVVLEAAGSEGIVRGDKLEVCKRVDSVWGV